MQMDGEVYVANSLGNNYDILPTNARQQKQFYVTWLSVDGSLDVNLRAAAERFRLWSLLTVSLIGLVIFTDRHTVTYILHTLHLITVVAVYLIEV